VRFSILKINFNCEHFVIFSNEQILCLFGGTLAFLQDDNNNNNNYYYYYGVLNQSSKCKSMMAKRRKERNDLKIEPTEKKRRKERNTLFKKIKPN